MKQREEYLSHVAERLRRMRQELGLSLRALGRRAGITAPALTAIESGRSSPSLATLHKLLRALDSDMAAFFKHPVADAPGPVFPAAGHQTMRDGYRTYAFLLPRRRGLRFEMLFETLLPGETAAEWEIHDCDMGCYVLRGGPLKLELQGVGAWTLRRGDAFYVKKGEFHRAMNLGRRPVELITVLDPPRY